MGRTTTVSDFSQGMLFDIPPKSGDGLDGQGGIESETRRTFIEPSPDGIYLGARPLGTYLQECGEIGALTFGAALGSLDWKDFEALYNGPGRAAYSPRLMVGLVMWGLFKGVSSLRGLESLCRTDLGCMWVSAGIQPDHSNIGRFIVRHHEQFEGSFFERVTQLALRMTNSGVKELAGDGTVVQAAASRYRSLKREALDHKLAATKVKAEAEPTDEKLAAHHAKYAAADGALKEREEKLKAKSKPIDSLRVSTTEPGATIQPLKNGGFAPSYKPSILANDARVIVAKDVDPSDEIAVVSGMLDEAEAVAGDSVERLLLDGNYCNKTILNEALNRDLDLLCPEHGENPKKRNKVVKSDFEYNEERDIYTCPMGQELTPRSRSRKGYVQYEISGCAGCPLREKCFSKKSTRRVVRRHDVDEAKDALRQVMRQKGARIAYAQRKAMVEPVFAFMRGSMNLDRFRRRGLQMVRLEFSLYAAAYNLGRVLAVLALILVALWASFTQIVVLPIISRILRLRCFISRSHYVVLQGASQNEGNRSS